MGQTENIVGKGENASYQNLFLLSLDYSKVIFQMQIYQSLFPDCFKNLSTNMLFFS